VSQAFLARWYIGGGYIDVSEVVVFNDLAKYTSITGILSLSGGESVSSCGVIVFLYIHFCDLKMAHSGRNMSSPA